MRRAGQKADHHTVEFEDYCRERRQDSKLLYLQDFRLISLSWTKFSLFMGKKAEKEAREAKEAAKRAEKGSGSFTSLFAVTIYISAFSNSTILTLKIIDSPPRGKEGGTEGEARCQEGVKSAAAAEKSAEAPESVELNAHNWTDEEQTLLNQGLAECPASMDKKERWKAIAAVVGTRSMKECAMRYKEVKENIIRKKTAEEARRRALSEQMGEAANAAAAEAYQASLAAAQADLANAGDEVDDMFEGMGGAVSRADDGAAADRLTEQGVVTTYAAGAKPHRNSKDISVSNLSVSFHGHPIIEGCELQLNWGNRYGFIGRNGSGKSTIMRVIGARAIPVPERIDIYHLTTDTDRQSRLHWKPSWRLTKSDYA